MVSGVGSVERRVFGKDQAILLGTSLLAVVLFLIGTWQGIGLRPDSVIYIGFWDEGRQQAPLYTIMLDVASLFASNRFAVAWTVNLAILLANIALLHVILESYGIAFWGRLLCVLAILFLPQFYYVHVTVLSEPVFLLCLLATCLLTVRAMQSGEWPDVVLAAALAALTVLSRFAAAPVVGAGALAILLYGAGTWGHRLRQAFGYGAIASAIFLAWMLWDRLDGGAGVDREFAFNGKPDAETFIGAVQTTSAYFLPVFVPAPLRFGVVAIFVAVLTLMTALVLWPRSKSEGSGALAFSRVCLLFVLLYIPFVVLTLYIEHDLHVHSRYLLPVYILSLLALTIQVFGRDSVVAVPSVTTLGTVVLVGLAMTNGVRGTWMARDLMTEGNFYQSELWKSSPIIQRVARLDTGLQIYTNAPVAVRLLLRRPAEFWPIHYDYRTGKPHPAHPYDETMARIAREVSAGQAIVVSVNQADWREYLATEAEVVAMLGLQPAIEEDDGRVYGLPHVVGIDD